jgi:hypothetical protein
MVAYMTVEVQHQIFLNLAKEECEWSASSLVALPQGTEGSPSIYVLRGWVALERVSMGSAEKTQNGIPFHSISQSRPHFAAKLTDQPRLHICILYMFFLQLWAEFFRKEGFALPVGVSERAAAESRA